MRGLAKMRLLLLRRRIGGMVRIITNCSTSPGSHKSSRQGHFLSQGILSICVTNHVSRCPWCSGTALWYRGGQTPLPIRWVLTRDRDLRTGCTRLLLDGPSPIWHIHRDRFHAHVGVLKSPLRRVEHIWEWRPNANGPMRLPGGRHHACLDSTVWSLSLDATSIRQETSHFNQRHGIASSKPPGLSCLLPYGGTSGTISVIRHHPKTLMSFYSPAQILPVLPTWSVPLLKMCKVQSFRKKNTDRPLVASRLPVIPQSNCRIGSGFWRRKSTQVIALRNTGRAGSWGASANSTGINGQPCWTNSRKNASSSWHPHKWVILRMTPTAQLSYHSCKKHEGARASRTLLEGLDHTDVQRDAHLAEVPSQGTLTLSPFSSQRSVIPLPISKTGES